MSNTIDSRVVEMRFDNRQFEQNVSTTMSTLDKLKAKLNFSGASKGLEDVNTAAKGVNMSGLGNAVEAVSVKFSALQVMGVTALTNITNSAVNAGKRMISALTIDPIKTGFEEYETQINSVQTILANTSNKGSTIDDVNRALEELNEYADMTIYNFTEMTRNIGTFTAAGIDLDTSVTAIQGIANLAAVSGSTSQQASTAMYQLSQALASGTVKLMDWNSVVNAGMGGEVFQNALKETSEALGTGAEAAIKASGSFRESLSDGWLTADVLTQTLKKFTSSGANEYVSEYTGLSVEAVEAALEAAEATYGEADAIEHASKALAEKSGKNADEIAEMLNFAKTANDAATKVKTFTQLWDVLKESAQSGWSQTWKLLVGDFEQAKAILTPLADFLTGIIGKVSDFRNDIIKGALDMGFGKIGETIASVTAPAKKALSTVQETANAVADLGDIVNKVIRGDFGNGADRVKALTDAGINYYEVQNKVNEALGDSFRHSQETIDAQNKLLGVQGKTVESTKAAAEANEELTAKQADTITGLVNMSEAQLKSAGYSEEQIEALRELGKTAESLGMPVDELIDKMDEIDGRWLMIESFKNIGNALIDVFKVLKEAFTDIFPIKPVEEYATSLFNALGAFYKFTRGMAEALYVNGEFTETGEKLVRTLKGVFALVDIISTVVGGAFRAAFKIAAELLGRFDIDLLGITANIGDAIVGFREWLNSIVSVSDVVDVLVPIIKSAAKFIGNLINTVKNSKWFGEFCDYVNRAAIGLRNLFDSISGTNEFKNLVTVIQKAGSAIREWFNTLKDSDNLPRDIIAGLAKGIREGGPEVIAAVFELAKSIITGICEVLGIASPSKEMIEIGRYTVEGLVVGILEMIPVVFDAIRTVSKEILLGIKESAPEIWNAIAAVGNKLIEMAKNIDFGSVLVIAFGVGMFSLAKNMGKSLAVLATPLEKFGDMCEAIGGSIAGAMNSLKGTFDALTKNIKASTWEKRGRAVLMFAGALAILVAAIFAITLIPSGKLWEAIGAIAALATILALLSIAIGKLGATDGAELGKFAMVLLGLSGALLIIGIAVKQMSELSANDLKKGAIAVLGISAILVGLVAATKLIGKDANKTASTLLKMTVVMALLVGVAKLAAGLDPETALKGGVAVLALGGVMVGLIAMTKLFGRDADKVGSTLIKMTIAMALMVGVFKLAAKLDFKTILEATPAILAFVGVFALLAMTTRLGGSDLNKLGSTLLAMASSMLLMAVVIKLLGGMSGTDIAKGLIVVTGLALIITGLVAATRLAGDNELKRVGRTLLMMSISIGILAIVTALLGMLSAEHLTKGLVAVTIFGAIVTAMIWATRGATDCSKNILMMSVAIGVMAIAIAALSLIDTSKVITSAAALGLVIAMFALLVKNASTMQASIAPLIVMTGAIAVLAGVLWLLSSLPVSNVLAVSASLSILLLSLTAALFIASKAGPMAAGALIALGVMTVIVGLLGFILYSLQSMPVESTVTNALILSELLVVIAGVCALMSLIPAAAAVQGALGLAAFIGIMTAVIAAFGGLSRIPGFNELIADGGKSLAAIGYAIGDFVGSIVGGLAAGITSGLPDIGTNLSSFMEKVTPFVEGVKRVDSSTILGAAALAGAIVALTAADFMSSVASFFTGEGSLAALGAELSAFYIRALPFIMGVTKIDPNMVAGVKALAETVLILTGASLLEGIASFITGDSSLVEFGAQLPALGTSISSFAANLGTFDESKVATVKCAADAIKSIASAASEIPNEGGWAGKIFGENGIASFAAKMPTVAVSLNQFATNLGTFDAAKLATVGCAAKAVKAMAEAASEIPNEGGWAGKIFGENGIASFATQLPVTGSSLKFFANNLGTFDEAKVATVKCAADAIVAMAQASENIDGQAEWAKKLFGDNSLASFAGQLPGLGTNLNGFVKNLGTFTAGQIGLVRASVDAVGAFASLANADLGSAKRNLEGFGEKLGGFGTDLNTFCTNMPSTTSVSSAVTSVKDILSAVEKVAAANTGALGDLAKNLKKVGGDAVNKFVGAFTSETAKVNVKEAADALADKAVEGVDNLDVEAESAGEDLGTGLVRGIRAKYQAAYDAGYALGQKAVQGEKDGQASNSPSKLTILAGKWLGEGLVIGIGKMSRQVYDSGHELGNTAVDSISSTVSKIADVINSDIDAQPTIAPVMDLSNVRTGVAAIDDMLGIGSTVDVLARANGITSTIDYNRQNGADSEVVSAINKLRKDLANVGNTTYSINGVTYDDGSNVSEAIRTITRYATIERRV